MDIRSRIIKSLEEIGILIQVDDSIDIDLREYIEDSLQFITAVVELEVEFGIEIPSELLIYDNFASLNSFCKIIEELLDNTSTD